MQVSSRRRFLLFTIGAGTSAGVAGRLLLRPRANPESGPAVSGRNSSFGSVINRTSRALGTRVSVQALHQDPAIARAAIDQAFAELELLEDLMSIYRPHSQLAELNRDGKLTGPHPYLLSVLRAAQQLSRRTQGAFDVTVQPLWRLFAQADRGGRLPNPAAIARRVAKVDWRRLDLSSESVRLRAPGAAITLNGIAQGFAADRVAAVLRRHRIRHALIDTGEIGAMGEKDFAAPWNVGIQHPRRPDAFVSLASLKNRCLATSGDYATNFGGSHQYHHIFDPRTGLSPTELASVSVAARTSIQADALSTAAFVLGPKKGFELIRSTPGADALMILKDGRTLASRGFPIVKGTT